MQIDEDTLPSDNKKVVSAVAAFVKNKSKLKGRDHDHNQSRYAAMHLSRRRSLFTSVLDHDWSWSLSVYHVHMARI